MAEDAATTTTDPAAGDGGQGGGTAPTEKTFTQADLDRIVGERVARERDKYADYDDLKATAGKVPDLETKLGEATGRVSELEPQVTRLSVAMAKGLPAELADRLRGTTEDELNEDADRLLALIPSGSDVGLRRPAPVPSQGGTGGSGAPGLNEDRLLSTVKDKLGIS